MPVSKRSPPESTSLVERLTVLLSVCGLLFYALLRVAYTRFYGPFHLSPDDLGLGYAQLLAQAAIGVVLLLSVTALVILLLSGLYVETLVLTGLVAWFSGGLRRWIWSRRCQPVVVAIGVAITLITIAGWIAGRYDYNAIAVVVLLTVSSGGLRRVWRGVAGERTAGANWWRRGVAAIVILSAVAAGDTLIATADQDAWATRNGLPQHPGWHGIQLTTWGSDAATLSWPAGKVDPALSRLANSCVMYLGESDGTLFVYLPYPPGPATYRIPAAGTTVRIAPDLRCRRGVAMPTR